MYWEEGSKSQPATVLFSFIASVVSLAPWIWDNLGCKTTCSGSKDGDQDALTIIDGPKAWEVFYRRKKQASRHRSVCWGAGSLISDRTEGITTFLVSFAFSDWHFSRRCHIPLIHQPSRRYEVCNWVETKSQRKIRLQQLFQLIRQFNYSLSTCASNQIISLDFQPVLLVFFSSFNLNLVLYPSCPTADLSKEPPIK